ncbi:MAG: PDZ domain-containing protein, partial [Planctomycetota bacterium]
QEGKPTLTNQDLFLAEVPLEPADFIWVISPVIEQKRIYLGVQLPKTGDNKLAIQTITPGSPAEKAGILPGDVILSIDGKNLKSVMELVHYLQTKRFGETCNVAVDRGGAPFSYSVELFEMPQE